MVCGPFPSPSACAPVLPSGARGAFPARRMDRFGEGFIRITGFASRQRGEAVAPRCPAIRPMAAAAGGAL